MPTSQKGMQRFLGAALFFKNFVPEYSKIAAPLHEMTHNDFSWNKSTWKKDYEASFTALKSALVNSTANHFPDYDLPWVLRVVVACGHTTDFYDFDFLTLFVYRSQRVSIQSSYFFF